MRVPAALQLTHQFLISPVYSRVAGIPDVRGVVDLASASYRRDSNRSHLPARRRVARLHILAQYSRYSSRLPFVSTFLYGRALILSRPPQTIRTSSKLIDAIKAHAPNGQRFAIADGAMVALPPNQEALFGLNSVNSYDSLSSRRYQELVGHWSAAGTRTYGRHFRLVDIERALADESFPFSNVRLILSSRPLATDQLALAAEVNGIKLYEPINAPSNCCKVRVTNSRTREKPRSFLSADRQSAITSVEVLNDFQKIEVTASPRRRFCS